MRTDIGPTILGERWPAVSFQFWPNVVPTYIMPTDTMTLAQHWPIAYVFLFGKTELGFNCRCGHLPPKPHDNVKWQLENNRFMNGMQTGYHKLWTPKCIITLQNKDVNKRQIPQKLFQVILSLFISTNNKGHIEKDKKSKAHII